ncbi:MAG: DRTGG domain-containing protein [Anaerolineae bacterium]
MIVRDVAAAIEAEVAAGDVSLGREVTGGYASDLLSCVMASAQQGNIWVTLQAHMNVIAVAVLLDLSAVVITEGVRPDTAVLARASEKGMPVLLCKQGSFTIIARLAQAGISGTR